MLDGTRFRKVDDALKAVLGKLPTTDSEALDRLWAAGVKFYIVDGLPSLGSCSDDGLRLCVSQKTAALAPRGLQLVLAHEIAHAFQIATDQVVDDKDAMERGAERIMRRWGFNDEEIEFWCVYASASKEFKRILKGALMRKDETLMGMFAEWRSEKEMLAA